MNDLMLVLGSEEVMEGRDDDPGNHHILGERIQGLKAYNPKSFHKINNIFIFFILFIFLVVPASFKAGRSYKTLN